MVEQAEFTLSQQLMYDVNCTGYLHSSFKILLFLFHSPNHSLVYKEKTNMNRSLWLCGLVIHHKRPKTNKIPTLLTDFQWRCPNGVDSFSEISLSLLCRTTALSRQWRMSWVLLRLSLCRQTSLGVAAWKLVIFASSSVLVQVQVQWKMILFDLWF